MWKCAYACLRFEMQLLIFEKSSYRSYYEVAQVQRKQNTHAIDQRGLCRCSKGRLFWHTFVRQEENKSYHLHVFLNELRGWIFHIRPYFK